MLEVLLLATHMTQRQPPIFSITKKESQAGRSHSGLETWIDYRAI